LTFFETITAAVRDFAQFGYDSIERLNYWIERIRVAADQDMIPAEVLQANLASTLRGAYTTMVERGGIERAHNGVSRVTIERIKPKLRAELDRRIMASADLIKLNRVQAREKTIQRFAGWATSIPVGGSDVVAKNPVKSEIRKSLAQLPFAERRVLIDQSAKLRASISDIVATDGGAIAATWHDHGAHDKTYNARPDHLARNGKVFAIRGNWAIEKGLMRAGPNGYTDEIEMVGELPLCRCSYAYHYALSQIPADMLTQAGRDELARVRGLMAA
jgi:hypothetical protein